LVPVIIEAGGSIYISNGTDVVHSFNGTSFTEYGSNSDDPPKGKVGCYFKNRLWLANIGSNTDYVQYSNTLAFGDDEWNDSTQVFKVGAGEGTEITAMVPFGDDRIIIFKEDSSYELIIQGAATDSWTLRVLDPNHGCVAYHGATYLNNDIYYISRDGIRSILSDVANRQQGVDVPLSWNLKDTWDDVFWAQMKDNARIVGFQDKILVAIPTANNAYGDTILAYFINTKGWSVWTGLNVGCFGTFDDDGDERLFYGEGTADSVVYELLTGNNDGSTAIHYKEETRAFNFGKPFERKVGGEIEITFETAGSHSITVSANPDDKGYTELGTITTQGLHLNLYLPFTLGSYKKGRAKFHLESLGRFRNIKFKIDHNATKSSNINFLEILLQTYPADYQGEL
jgi:hypothetical protein